MTLVEMMITLALTGIVFYSITIAVKTSGDLYDSSATTMDVDAEGSRAMARIVEALRGTRASSIAALPAPPLCASTLQFSQYEPFSGQMAALSDPIQVALDGDELTWIDAPLLATERRASWLRNIPAMYEGEVFNGADDNGNGINDEPGLYFVRRGSTIEIGLTLQDGDVVRSWTSRVACRN